MDDEVALVTEKCDRPLEADTLTSIFPVVSSEPYRRS
jgi:hypothetical protein